MDVVSVSPFRVAQLRWQPAPGAWALTVICKATYRLAPIESTLEGEQEDPNEEDNHWNDDGARSLSAPSDLAPFKTRAEVMLVGHAFAPRKQPARSVVARLIVGEVDKSIEVFGDRAFTQEGQLREGPRFLKMPLRWERAAGGPGTVNPVGVRADAPPDRYGLVAIPNLQPPGRHVIAPGDFVEPVGFGPIAPMWPGREEKVRAFGAAFARAGWRSQPLPEGFDHSFFNAAPPDQQLDELRPDERIILENLHPDHARLVTSLPGVRPRACVERPGGSTEELVLRADTLWIDTDRGICTLTWRGQALLGHPSQAGRISVAMESPGQRLTLADIAEIAARRRREEARQSSARASDAGRGAPVDLDEIEQTTDVPPEDLVEVTRDIESAQAILANLPFSAPSRTTPPPPPIPPASTLSVRVPTPRPSAPWTPAAVPALHHEDLSWSDAPAPSHPLAAPGAPGPDVVEIVWVRADDRRDVASLLLRGDPLGAPGIPRALASAVSADGRFIAPLVLVAGELEFPFDEVETLRATLVAASPLVGGDGRLRDALGAAREFLGIPWIDGAGGVAASLTARIREALAEGGRPIPRSLEAHTERMLLARRSYQKRTLLGRTWLRALLTPPGAAAAIPTYVPGALTNELPMFQRFRARVAAEARVQIDQQETHPFALEVVALGRLLPASVLR